MAVSFMQCVAVAMALLGVASSGVSAAQAAPYTAPRDGLDAGGMSYQLGIWSAILLVSVALYGFYSLGSMDYSGDTALYVDTGSASSE